MTRFDAADAAERQRLFADAVAAHRERASPFLTVEAEVDESDDAGESMDDEAPEPAPWVQFADATLNLDCTDDELDRLKDLLGSFPAFEIAEITRPDDAEGANVRVSARVDGERVAEFVERTFREVYDLDEDYRAWVVEI